VIAPRERGGLLLRLGFLLLVGGGLLFWSEFRRPRDVALDVDLTGAFPGDIVEVDVTVLREGHAIVRFEQRYGPTGAPATLHVTARARPGPAEVDVMLVDAQGKARRTRATVELRKDAPAAVKPQ
jgi:hypothetical protein